MGFSVNEILQIDNLCVYLHRIVDTGTVFYVGLGKPKRPTSMSGRNPAWRNIVKEYGYTIEIVAQGLTKTEAIAKEMELIAYYRSLPENILTNITSGGQGHYGHKASEETKKKLRESHLGKKHTPEQTAKIKEKLTGLKRTQEQKDAQSKARKGKNYVSRETQKRVNEAKRGVPIHTEESKRKIGIAVSARVITAENRLNRSIGLKGRKMPIGFGAKISEIKRGNTNRLGMTRTPEEKAKISASLKGKPWSEARRSASIKIGASHGL